MVSIIVVTYNVEKYLFKNKLTDIPLGKEIEIIFIDNNSTDKTRMLLEKLYPTSIKIFNNTNVGFANAVNQAYSMAKGKYILLVNPDTIVSYNSIRNMVQFLRSKKDAAGAGCKVLNPNGSLQTSCGNFPTFLIFIID